MRDMKDTVGNCEPILALMELDCFSIMLKASLKESGVVSPVSEKRCGN